MAKKKKTKKKAAAADKLVRILSIDGGGIRGILPGQILVALEELLKEEDGNPSARIADYFDLVAGTSTGGILACAYLCPETPGDVNSRPKFSAQDAVNIYLERGDEIFDVTLWQKVKSGGGITDEKYDAAELEDALSDNFGDTHLAHLLKPCLITTYDIKRRTANFLTQHDAKKSESQNFYVRDVARCTSAAPTYFEAARVKSMTNITYPMIDGGVFANNPAMCAYSEARTMSFAPPRPSRPTALQMMIMSLGTGAVRKPYVYKEAKDWGKAGWIAPLIDILFAGNSDTVDYHLRQIYDAVERPDQYIRIEPPLGDASPEMDDASPKNLDALREAGTFHAEQRREVLRAFAQMLIANK